MSEAPFKAGFAAILGLPNAGKSTLINAFLRTKLSIVSAKPQTTRENILGILNGEGYQLCLLDTPGLLAKAKNGLQKTLIRSVSAAVQKDADILIWVAFPFAPNGEDRESILRLRLPSTPLILALNKIDAARPEDIEASEKAHIELLKPAAVVRISAKDHKGIKELLAEVVRRLPDSPAFYGDDQLSDRWERFFAAEIVRENIFELFDQEIPHACAVKIESFKENKGRPDAVSATIFVEKESQKPILIGKGGRKIKELNERSVKALETFLEREVDLDLRVSVRKNWRQDQNALKDFGYQS